MLSTPGAGFDMGAAGLRFQPFHAMLKVQITPLSDR
jgi:hypothetical protein